MLVGAGRVGSSLAIWARDRGAVLSAIGGRSDSHGSRQVADELGVPWVSLENLSSHDQDLLLIAVSDSALSPVAEELSQRPQAPVALHTAGCHDKNILGALGRAGCAVGSLHPLLAFPHRLGTPPPNGSFFAIDGDPRALRISRDWARAFGGESAILSGAQRTVYHLAATLAAGGVATLLSMAFELSENLGLPENVLAGYLDLARSALLGVEVGVEAGDQVGKSITGPLARGDARTVESHLEALAEFRPELTSTITALGLETLRQLDRAGISSEQHKSLHDKLLQHTETSRKGSSREGSRKARKGEELP